MESELERGEISWAAVAMGNGKGAHVGSTADGKEGFRGAQSEAQAEGSIDCYSLQVPSRTLALSHFRC